MKTPHFLRLLVLGFLGFTLSQPPAATAGGALLGLWRFDETSGTNAMDSSGLNNHGVLRGDNGNLPGYVPSQAGFGNALRFTNNAVDFSYVDVPGHPLLKIGMTADDTWTLAIWAYEVSDGSGYYVATYGRFLVQDTGLGIQWDSASNSDPNAYMWHNSLAAWQNSFGPFDNSSMLDHWLHWALVYDGTNLTFYRDGNQGPYGAKKVVPVHASLDWLGYSGSIQIGSQLNMDAARTWNGMLDDVAVFKGALSEAEIRTIMTGNFTNYIGGAPKVVEQMDDQVVNPGWDATLGIAISGAPTLKYQWWFKGSPLAGATQSTLLVTNVQENVAGPYTIVVTNDFGATNRVIHLAVSVPPPPILVGLWRLDEGSGTNTLDSSGWTNHGVLAGDVLPTWVEGRPGFGQALKFVNDGASHAYVDIAANDSLRFGMTANATWSITAWVNEISDGYGNYVATYGRVFGQNGGFGINFDSGASGDSQFYIWHHYLSPWQRGFGTTAAVVPVFDTWVHLALVYDGNNLILYRNGNQGTLGAKTALPTRAGLDWGGYGSSIQIGDVLNNTGRSWNGMIDDFAIFTGALTESQVRTVAAGDFSAFAGGHPQLVMQPSGGHLVLNWNWGVLQSTTDLGGTWQDETTAQSPYSLSPEGAREFFRVRP